jgi:Ribosomal protein S2
VVLVVTGPAAVSPALSEAVSTGLPIVGLLDATLTLRDVALALPAVDPGRRSLALISWLLARGMLTSRGAPDFAAWGRARGVAGWGSSFWFLALFPVVGLVVAGLPPCLLVVPVPLFLAPLAGVSALAYRLLARGSGAGLAFPVFTAASGLSRHAKPS